MPATVWVKPLNDYWQAVGTVTYRDDPQTAEVDLDNTPRDFEALQERLGLLVPA